jgi:2,4-diaminopentanoate dehydrogenase
MTKPVGVIHYGLGPIGVAVARVVGGRSSLRSVGAVDIREDLVGRDLAHHLGSDTPRSVSIVSAIADANPSEADIVLHCTGSSLAGVGTQLLEFIEAGLNVISTCEELSYPWEASRGWARTLDDAAKRKGVTILATGVNPGFVMDLLPLTLTAVAERVDSVTVHRTQEAGNRRLPLQRKIGVGLTADEFEAGVGAGSIRHVGLRESVAMIAAALGWDLTRIDETVRPLVADHETDSGLGMVPIGAVTGVHQISRGWEGTKERIVLVLKMGVGLDNPCDRVELNGSPSLTLTVAEGIPGDMATAAIVVNAIPRVLAASPGLATMIDLPVPVPAPPIPSNSAPIKAEATR